jgi:hypothetical protein
MKFEQEQIEAFSMVQVSSAEDRGAGIHPLDEAERLPYGYIEGEEESEEERNMFDPEIVKKFINYIKEKCAVKNRVYFQLKPFKFGKRPDLFKNGYTTMKAVFRETDAYMYYGEMRTTEPEKFCGKGMYIHKSNGLFHEGWYENAMFNGYGRHVKDHAIFEGIYKNDRYERG